MRTLWLVGAAMVMFAVGVAVMITAENTPDYLLAVVAIIGSFAVVVANVNGPK